jgi:undecaprenyl-diphosphatase
MLAMTRSVLEFIEVQDHTLMRAVNRWRAPRWVRLGTLCATRGGDGWLWYALGAVLAAVGGAEGLVAARQATLAAVAGIGVFLWLKRLAKRRRPCAIEPHCWATLLPPDQFSFPSGHTMTAFAVVVPVVAHFPGTGPGLWICALSVAASRILLGMHFLSDVVAGAALGALLGLTARAF